MPDTLDAAELRRMAIKCAARAEQANCDAAERGRLMAMRESLLALAENADWLAGKRTAQTAPEQAAE
jgi:hypothetical protein